MEEDNKVEPAEIKPEKSRQTMKIDMRWIVALLLIINIAMVAIWQPWSDNGNNGERFVAATGEATVEETPDEFTFNPYFEDTGTNQEKLRDDMAKKMEKVVQGLKDLGVAEEDLTLGAYSYDEYYYLEPEVGEEVISVKLSVKVTDKELAQSVQDYLLDANAQGKITPYATFSDDKRKELESQARGEAIADARAKAEQSADLLEAEIGEVLQVAENSGFDDYLPYTEGSVTAVEADAAESSIPVLPGQDKVVYTVDVKFAIK